MKEIQNLLQKIEQEANKKIEDIKRQIEEQKSEIVKRFKELEEKQKKELKQKQEKEKEILKKRVFAEKYVEYNKYIEKIKNSMLSELTEKIAQEILNLSKTEYYQLLKNIITKNLFFGEKNLIIFDQTGKLSKEEQKKLISEVLNILNDKTTTIEISEERSLKFGVKIISGKKSKEFSLETILSILKPYCEEEINKFVSQIL